jgi:histidinol-phosphate aminotransferase
MIRPREHLLSIERDVQACDTQEGVTRLNMNEYLPYASRQLYDELLKRLHPEVLSAYPMVNTAYHAISILISQPNDKLVLTSGADGVVLSTLQAFCNPGDLVGYVTPTYGMYQVYAEMLCLKTKCIAYDSERTINRDKILDCITSAMKVFILANPNGMFGDDLEEDFVIQMIKKGNHTGTIILLDEVYADFVDGGHSRFLTLTDEYDNLVLARSFSKSYGLAGVRAGYSISNIETRRFLIAVRNNVEINSLAVEAIKVWCSYPDLLKESIREILLSKKKVCQVFREYGIYVIEGTANFILIQMKDEEYIKFTNELDKKRIAVKCFDLHKCRYIRITVGTIKYMEPFIEIVKVMYGG